MSHLGGIAFSLTFLSIFVSPLLMTLFLPQDLPLAVLYARASLFVLIFLLLPLIVGILTLSHASRYKPQNFVRIVTTKCD